MLCEICKKNQATMKLTRIINNKKTVIHLCNNCARETGNSIPSPMDGIGSILSGLMGLDTIWNSGAVQAASKIKKCPVCGMTQDEIVKDGKLGCSECYITFIDEMRPLLRKIHGNCVHHGKIPDAKEASPVKLHTDDKNGQVKEASPDEIEILQCRMKDAILSENFEEAAKIRDELKKKQAEGADK